MADDTVLNPGAGGDTIRTDEIAGIKFPTTKITLGADGADDGFVEDTNPLPTKFPPVAWNAPTFVAVGVASGLALAANANRKGATFVNDSVNTIYLGIGANAVVGSGIRLNANGGAYEINGFNLNVQAINAIATGAASNMGIHEGV